MTIRHKVTLTEDELLEAEVLGLQRLHESRKGGRYAHRSERERAYYHRMVDDMSGAAAERAVCKLLDEPWQARINTFHQVADVGIAWEVRSSSLTTNHSLILRDDDPDERFYIMVLTDQAPDFKILGMILGADAKQPQWRRDPHRQRPAWFVPPQALQPIRTAVRA